MLLLHNGEQLGAKRGWKKVTYRSKNAAMEDHGGVYCRCVIEGQSRYMWAIQYVM
jgi:hypothetical protein